MAKPKVLVIDDDKSVRDTMRFLLHEDYAVIEAECGKAGLEELRKQEIYLVFLDVMMPEMNGIETLQQIKAIDKNIQVCMVTAVSDTATAVKATKLGAYDYLIKPAQKDKLLLAAQHMQYAMEAKRENEALKLSLREFIPEGLVTTSPRMKEVLSSIKKISSSHSNVLITGESGTGKEVLARMIHKYSNRNEKPFVAINCCAIPDTLLESEMFGFEKGSFTGAAERKIGKFEMADQGTLFLDEIGSMSHFLQGKLLRIIQDGEFTRLGSTKTISVDVRIISATHVDLKESLNDKSFREDLYYRLKVVPLHLPPLRERPEDIGHLFDFFQKRFNTQFNYATLKLSDEALEVLEQYPWPGNIRELENLVERLMAIGKKGVIRIDDLPLDLLLDVDTLVDLDKNPALAKTSFKAAMMRFEKDLIIRCLQASKSNKSKAAEIMGIHRNTLMEKLKEHNL